MPRPGDVVLVDFAGATGVKRRPAVVVSSDTDHASRPDLIVCLLTTQSPAALSPTDCILQDWPLLASPHPPFSAAISEGS